MKSVSGLQKCVGVTGKGLLGIASLCLISGISIAADVNGGGGGGKSYVTISRPGMPSITPPKNTTPGTYRALIADGSSLYQAWAGDTVKWYAVRIEPGKTYVVDAVDPYTDYINGSVAGLGIYEIDGTTTPPAETDVNCGAESIAPGLANFGLRCIIRAFVPSGTTLNDRLVFIRVDQWVNTAFQIRVRESTVYGRWTTNNYDFHVEVQNTTAKSVCAQIIFYPNSGLTYSGGVWSGPLAVAVLTIPPFGANKYVLPDGTLVGTDKRGTLRVGACFTSVDLNSAAIQVNTLGYSQALQQFLPYSTVQPNAGSGNSF